MEVEDNVQPGACRDEKDVLAALELAEKEIRRLTELDRQHKLFERELQKKISFQLPNEKKFPVRLLPLVWTVSSVWHFAHPEAV